MKVTVTGIVHELDFGYGPKEYVMYSSDQSGDYYAAIGPASFEYEVPDNFSPAPAKLAALEREKEEARKNYTDKVMEINDRIAKLQAIEYTPA